jgi:CheY-like chemotaxis protein
VNIAVRRSGLTVDVAVDDTGQGIARDFLPHVFEAFRQADSSSTRVQGGVGLGLALVRHIVELHGGRVRAESEGKDRGSTFTVTLPLAGSHPKTEERDSGRSEEGGGALEASLRGVRVLVVDDNAETLDVAAVVLRVAGAEVRTASAAFSAYELIQSWQPHVVLTDLAMPGEDGFGLLRAMRTAFAERSVTVPIVAFTAYGSTENRTRALQAGFDLYLTKPIDPRALTSALAGVVARGTRS